MKNAAILSLCVLIGLVVTQGAMAQLVVDEGAKLGVTLGEEQGAEGKGAAALRGAAVRPDGRRQYILQLASPSVAAQAGDLGSPTATAAVEALGKEQDAVIELVRSLDPGSAVLQTYQAAFNGIAVAIIPSALDAVRALPGVAKVYPDRIVTQSMDASLPLINAPVIWAQLGGQSNAGAGVKVAVVDGGIRPESACFDGTGFTPPPGFPLADDYCGLTDPGFCNGKLIAARSFSAGYISALGSLDPAEVDTPLGINGHGTHVAGSAVCNAGVTATAPDGVPETISGVAPAAWLMAYKALWWNGTTGSGFDSDLIAAVNAAVVDGADVINNSWGGGAGADPATSVYEPLFETAELLGVVVVSAAGNSGPGPQTVGCPGCIESGITVAATTTNRIHGFPVSILGPGTVPAELTDMGAIQGTSTTQLPVLPGTLGPLSIVYAGDLDAGNFEGCNPFPAGSMTGALALISRGACAFATKEANANDAGAAAMIVFNNVAGPPIVMGSLAGPIPSVMLSDVDGQATVAWVQANPTATGQIEYPADRQTNDDWQDWIADFSSRGPNGDADILKPDIGAPGVRILSAWSPDHPTGGSEFSIIQGTSMASPHVAGAAALVRQQHPSWSPAQIKTALTSTSVGGLVKEDGVTPADPFDHGAGRMDLGRAADAAATFDKPSMGEDACFIDCQFTRRITNVSGEAKTWTATVMNATDPNLGVTVTPATVNLTPGGNSPFTIEVDTSLAAPNDWHFADVVWQDSSSTSPDASLPLAVFAQSSTNAKLISKTADRSAAQQQATIEYTVTATNVNTDGELQVIDVLPDNVTFLDADPVEIDGMPTTVPAFSAGPPEALSFSAMLAKESLSVAPSPAPAGYLSLPGVIGTAPLPCSSVCDETSITLSGFGSFDYLGETYTDVVMVSNGFIVPGADATGALPSFINTDLPDPTPPNNMIAPFWTDIDMDGTSGMDTGAGIWYADVLTDGTNFFLVMEWEAVEEFGVVGPTYTFQIWIQLGTSNIWFTYGAVPGAPNFLTVGAENATGGLGDSYYFDGAGTLPVVGTDLEVATVPGGQAVMTYRVQVNNDAEDVAINTARVLDDTFSEVGAAFNGVEILGEEVFSDGFESGSTPPVKSSLDR